jgi:hypothetical protein
MPKKRPGDYARTEFVDFCRVSKMSPLAVLVISLLGFFSINGAAQTIDQKQTALKEQMKKIPAGKAIEVRFLRKEKPQITGKLLEVDEESFKIQTSRPGKASTEEVAFNTVRSVNKRGMRRIYKVLIGAAAAAGAGIAVASTRSSRCG